MEDNNGISGILNVGNSCYINSIVQCINHTEILKKYIMSGDFKEDFNKNNEGVFLLNYIQILNMMLKQNCVVKPMEFRKLIALLNKKFNNMEQHDAHEFLVFMIDTIHKALSYTVQIKADGIAKTEMDKLAIESIKISSTFFNKEYSFIIENFYGQFHSTTECNNCKFMTHTFDPFCYLTLSLNGCIEIEECLDNYCKIDKIDEDGWRCDKCNQKKGGERITKIWNSPNILIIQLKRFEYDGTKIMDNINFGFELDMSHYVDSYDKTTKKYKLYSICCHSGDHNGGHYYSYCLNNKKWFLFNDEQVNQVEQINSKDAYILFYKKND